MIISISGKIESGKDLTGSIIRYLTMCNVKLDYTEKQFNEFIPFLDKSKWEIKKFADRLKECASLILGIPREDFEKIEVKNRVLGEEWTRYEQFDRSERQWIKTSKEFYNKYYNNIKYSSEFRKIPMTVRDFLQQFGTNACRDQVHQNFWVNALFSKYRNLGNSTKINGTMSPERATVLQNYPLWIITDMRFHNELEAVKNRKGITIRVNRNNINLKENSHLLHSTIQNGTKKLSDIQEHLSETALDNAVFNHTINNNGTIEELIVKVKEILIKEKII